MMLTQQGSLLGTFYDNQGDSYTPTHQADSHRAFLDNKIPSGTFVSLDESKIVTKATNNVALGVLMPYSDQEQSPVSIAIEGRVFVRLIDGDNGKNNPHGYVFVDSQTGFATTTPPKKAATSTPNELPIGKIISISQSGIALTANSTKENLNSALIKLF